jgi:hypothetical protein
MGPSEVPRARLAWLAAATLAATLAACDALLGLGDYSRVGCAFNCDSDSGEGGSAAETGGPDSTVDAGDAGDGSDATDVDAGEASMADGTQDAPPPGDGGGDGPTLLQGWAQWPMPNPDAAIGPESSTLLPNVMSYEGGISDAGMGNVYDNVTRLTWSASKPATTITAALTACAAMTGNWHVPTRIQLVSLIDFTQPSVTIDLTTFPDTQPARYWSWSELPNDGGSNPSYWLVDFGTGLTAQGNNALLVRCVSEP